MTQSAFIRTPISHTRPPHRVSVVIPVLNGADVISEQLEALTVQHYDGEWEVVVADNGSTDNLAEVVARFDQRLPGLRIIDASAMPGVGPARNLGVLAASGDAALFCDADDVCSPLWVASMANALATSPVVGGPNMIENRDGTTIEANVDLPTEKSTGVMFAIGGNFGIWIDVLDELGGFDHSYPSTKGDDVALCMSAWEHGYATTFAPGALIVKRPRGTTRALFQQFRGYGSGSMFNAYRFRDRFDTRGMFPAMFTIAARMFVWELRVLAWMFVHLAAITTGNGRRRWVRWFGRQTGMIEGLIIYRKVDVLPRPVAAQTFPRQPR